MVIEEDPLDRYHSLDSSDLKLSLSKAITDFDLIKGVTANSLKPYLSVLNMLQHCKSPVFPPSFVVALKTILEASICQEEVKRLKKRVEVWFTLHNAAQRIQQVWVELKERFAVDEEEMLMEDELAVPSFLYGEAMERVKELVKAVNSSTSPSNHLECIKKLLRIMRDTFEEKLKGILYNREEGRLVVASLVSKAKMKELRKLSEGMNGFGDAIRCIVKRLLRLSTIFGECVCEKVPRVTAHRDVLWLYLECAHSVVVAYCKDAVEGATAVSQDLTCEGLVVAVEDAWKKCVARSSEGLEWSVRRVLFPYREAKKYESGGKRTVITLREKADQTVAFRGCETIEDHFLLFRVSGDGTLATKASNGSNSWYCFTLSLTNLPPIRECMGKDVFFLFIIPESAASILRMVRVDPCATLQLNKCAGEATMNHVAMIDAKMEGYAVEQTHRDETLKSIMREVEKETIKFSTKRTRKDNVGTQECKTGSNSYARLLINIILKEAREIGDRGVLVSYGNKALHIHYGVLNVKGDLKACDEMADCAGLSTSNSPCRQCGICYSRLDLNTGLSPTNIENNLHKLRDDGKGLHSAFSHNDMSNVLRLTNHLSFLLHRGDGDPVSTLRREAARVRLQFTDAQVRDLRKLTSLLALFPHPHPPYCPSSMQFLPEFVTEYEHKRSTVCPYSNGLVELSKCMGYPISRCICPDLMHLVVNALKDFMNLLFGKQGEKNVFDAAAVAAFQGVGVSLKDGQTGQPWWYFPPEVKDGIKTSVVEMKLDNDPLLKKAVIDEKYMELKTHEYHVLVFCYMPVLLSAYQGIPAVRNFVSLIAVFQRLYNCRRLTPDVPLLQTQLDLHKNGLEAATRPDSGNPSYHYTDHLDTSIRVFGTLRANDCYPEEASFFPLKQLVLATPKPSLTVFYKAVKRSALGLVKVDSRKIISLSTPQRIDSAIVAIIKNVTRAEIQVRTRFNYEADRDWMTFGLFNQRTLWDVEKLMGVAVLLQMSVQMCFGKKRWDEIRRHPLEGADGKMSTMKDFEDVKRLFEYCGFTEKTADFFGYEECNARCCVDGTQFSATNLLLNELSVEEMVKNPTAFAFVYDYEENLHLYALCAFFRSRIDDNYFEQVWAYEVPHIPVCQDSKTQSCCFVDVNGERMKKTPVLELLSIRRCVGGLRVMKYNSTVVAVVSEKTGTRQLIHCIPFSGVCD